MADIPTPNPSHDVQLPPIYRSLEEIRLRKAQLRMELQKDTTQMRSMTHTLFQKEEVSGTPSQRLVGFVTKGAGFVDGMLLVWKLYRRFHGGSVPAKRKNGGLFGLFGGGKKKKKKKR